MPVQAGDLIYVYGGSDVNPATLTPTDNCGTGGASDTYTQLDVPVTQTGVAATWITTVGANTGTCTVTLASSAGGPSLAAYAIKSTSGIDVHAIQGQASPGTGANAVTSGSVTTTSADLCVGATADWNVGGSTLAAGTGFALQDASATLPLSDEDLSQAVPGAIAATFTYGGAFGQMVTAIGCFKPGTPGPTPPPSIAAQFYMEWAAGVAGAVITETDVAASMKGCTSGVTVPEDTSSDQFVYGAVDAAPVFPAPVTICGETTSGIPNKPIVLASASSPVQVFEVRPTPTPKFSMGQYYCADFDEFGDGAHSYSWDAFEDTGGASEADLVYNQTGITLESNGSAVTPGYVYHGSTSSCGVDGSGHPLDNTSWLYFTIQANSGSPQQMSLYAVHTDGSLNFLQAWTGTNQTTDIGVLLFGKSGGEPEVAGHHTYGGTVLVDNVNGVYPLLPQ